MDSCGEERHRHSPLCRTDRSWSTNEDERPHVPYGLTLTRGEREGKVGGAGDTSTIGYEQQSTGGSSSSHQSSPTPVTQATGIYNSDHTVNMGTDSRPAAEEPETFRPYVARGRISVIQFRDIEKADEERRQKELEMLKGGGKIEVATETGDSDGVEADALNGGKGRKAKSEQSQGKTFVDGYDRDPDVVPDYIYYRRDVDDDGYTLRRIGRSLTYIIQPIYFGLKVAALVTLPLCILSFYDPVKSHFQAGSLLAVVGTANAQLFVGTQLSGSILILQGACWLMLWGTVMNCIGVQNNEGAWWGLAFTSVIIVSFFPNLRSRKLMMSYGIIIMQMQRTAGGSAVARPANVAACLILSVCFAAFQSFLPFPMLMIKLTDQTFANAWCQVGSIAVQLRGGVWGGGSYAGFVQSSRSACDDLGAIIADMPSKLFLITYEPFERSLWNQLRNVRLTLLRRLLVILCATCTAAATVASLRSTDTVARSKPIVARLQGPVDDYLEALTFTLRQLGKSLDPAETVANCKFDDLLAKRDTALTALQDCLSIASTMDPDTTDAPAFYAFIYFHLLLFMITEELSTLGDQMAAFDPSQYKSTWRRFLEFFFLDFWDDFRNKLPKRLMLRTPADRRSFKEGIKLACAYCVAAAFTVRLNAEDVDDTYFFGMSIILGIGLPTASESIEVGIQRICGVSFALAIGYLAEWKTNNFAQALAIVVCGSFVCVCFRSTQRYMHVAYYASFIAPAAYGIAGDRVTMIARVVDNSFAVMSYLAICSFMFPINPFRVLWNKQTVINKYASEVITQLASVGQLSLTPENEDIAHAKLQIAADKLNCIGALMHECETWMAISAKEPIIIGKQFPTTRVNEIHSTKVHLVAGLDVWLLGLQILRRERSHPPHPAVLRMVRILCPILRDVEAMGRYVFQDMIDAIELPLSWSQDRSCRHFNEFVNIKARLDATFHELHKSMMAAQKPEARRQAVAEALAMGVDLNSPAMRGNRSFVRTAFISPDPRNVRGKAHNGVYDAHDALFPQLATAEEARDAEDTAHRQSPSASLGIASPSPAGNQGQAMGSASYTATQSNNNNNNDNSGVGNSSFAAVTPGRCANTTRMSFRAPIGNLPVDVDVTAVTICVMSIGTLIAALETLVPLIGAVNDFERSRMQAAVTSVKQFYTCKQH